MLDKVKEVVHREHTNVWCKHPPYVFSYKLTLVTLKWKLPHRTDGDSKVSVELAQDHITTSTEPRMKTKFLSPITELFLPHKVSTSVYE